MIKLDEIKFGVLSEVELISLKNKITIELNKRAEKPEDYINVVRGDDGCEGFYCKIEDFHKINSVELHRQIALTLSQGSTISFSIEQIEKDEYEKYCKQYEWNFDNQTMNKEDDDE